jgi:hypothetical protein
VSEQDPPGGEQPKKKPKKQMRIAVPDEQKHGTYANFLVVSHSAHEFTLDFCQMQPGQKGDETTAEVVSRVRIAPTLVGKVIRALNTNMTNYEDRFGLVKEIG